MIDDDGEEIGGHSCKTSPVDTNDGKVHAEDVMVSVTRGTFGFNGICTYSEVDVEPFDREDFK